MMGNVPAHEIKENIELLVQKAKTVTPSVTVSSVLPCSKGANPEQLAEVNSAIKQVCDDMNVIFVDHESNLTFRNGDVDICLSCGRHPLVCERCGQSVFTPQADIAEDGEAATTSEHSAIGYPCRRKSSEIDSPYNQP